MLQLGFFAIWHQLQVKQVLLLPLVKVNFLENENFLINLVLALEGY
jgi:hypothetical protein